MLRNWGRMIRHPIQQLDRMTRTEDGDFFEGLWFFAVVVAALNLPALHQASLFFEQNPFGVIQRFLDVVAYQGQSIFLYVGAWVLIFWGASKVLLGSYRPVWQLFNASAYLLVPFALLLALGQIAALADLDHWAWPHQPIHAPVIWTAGEVNWQRYLVKILLTYTWPTAVGVGVLWRWRKNQINTDACLPARSGLGVGTLVLVMLWVGSLAQTASQIDRFKPVLVGDAFPKVTLPWIQARDDDPRGEVETGLPRDEIWVLDFWASWCGPCLRALPELEKIAKDYENRGVRVVGVNREPNDLPAAKAVLKEADPRFRSVVDRGQLAREVGLQVLPTTYLLDRSGQVKFLHLGALDADALRAAIDRLLEAP